MSSPEFARICGLLFDIHAQRGSLESIFEYRRLAGALANPTERDCCEKLIAAHESSLQQIHAEKLDEDEWDARDEARRVRGGKTGQPVQVSQERDDYAALLSRCFVASGPQRRRRSAIARAWCIQSGITGLRDLTDSQCRITVEILRLCLKSPRRATYLTYGQIAGKAGCARSTAITAMGLLESRELIHVHRRRIGRSQNAPNLYFPCPQLVQQLGPLVDPARDDGAARTANAVPTTIGVQCVTPLYNRYKYNNTPTVSPTQGGVQKSRSQGVAPSAGATESAPPTVETTPQPIAKAETPDCLGMPKPRFPQHPCQPSTATPAGTSADRALLAQAVALVDGKPIGNSPDIAELLARSEAIRQTMLPKLLPGVFAHHARRDGIAAPAALLATVLKRLTRSRDPIRDPFAYYLGTIRRARAGGQPLESLTQVMATHAAQTDRIDIPARYGAMQADAGHGQHGQPPPPVTTPLRDEGTAR